MLNEVSSLLESLSPESIEKDVKLLCNLNAALNSKVGIDKEMFAELKKEHEKEQKMYNSLFDAIEDELINKADLKLQL